MFNNGVDYIKGKNRKKCYKYVEQADYKDKEGSKTHSENQVLCQMVQIHGGEFKNLRCVKH